MTCLYLFQCRPLFFGFAARLLEMSFAFVIFYAMAGICIVIIIVTAQPSFVVERVPCFRILSFQNLVLAVGLLCFFLFWVSLF